MCSGGADKLVPYHCAEPFLKFLKNAVGGWWKDGGVEVEDIVYEGVGHKFNADMMKDVVRFINDAVAGSLGGGKAISKM